jgi:hypothetical protein
LEDPSGFVLSSSVGLDRLAFDVSEDENEDWVAVLVSFRGDVLRGSGKISVSFPFFPLCDLVKVTPVPWSKSHLLASSKASASCCASFARAAMMRVLGIWEPMI